MISNPNKEMIDMTQMLSGDTDNIEIDRSFFLPQEFLHDAVIGEPLKAVGRIENISGYMKLTLEIVLKYKTLCARCLHDLDRVLRIAFEKTLAAAGTLENEETDEVIEDYIIVSDNKLDLTQVAEEQLLFEFPSKHLCSEDCKGLCQKCGHDLNESDCGCVDTEIDPRLELLKTLLVEPDDKK